MKNRKVGSDAKQYGRKFASFEEDMRNLWMRGVLQKIWRGFNSRYIFFRVLVGVECDIEKNLRPHEPNKEDSQLNVTRIRNIDKLLQDKIKNALLRMDFHPPFDIEEARSRLRQGYYFFILEYDDEIIGWTWYGIDSIYVTEIEKEVALSATEAFAFNTYIAKEYRNRGFHRLLLNEELLYLHDEGFSKVWTLIYRWNSASIKSVEGIGWKIVANFYYLRFLFIKIIHRAKLGQEG